MLFNFNSSFSISHRETTASVSSAGCYSSKVRLLEGSAFTKRLMIMGHVTREMPAIENEEVGENVRWNRVRLSHIKGGGGSEKLYMLELTREKEAMKWKIEKLLP